jgi:hypothetical protein
MKILCQVRFFHGLRVARARPSLRAGVCCAALVAAALLGACQSGKPLPEDPPASREDVTAALQDQLDLVLARHDALAGSEDPAALEERHELARLADEIALRLVRIDPEADVEELKAKLERTR